MNYDTLISAISDAHQQALAGAAGAVNRHLILRNWVIGAYLVEFEQNGEDRAKYGADLLRRVSSDLRRREIPGTSPDLLERMRLFFHNYPQFGDHISATPMRKSALSSPTPLSVNTLFRFSWSHFVELIRLDDPWKRAFYENECLKGNWSVRQLQRQIGSLLYERTGLSTDKDQTKVEYATGGLDHQLFVSRYLVALPKPEQLQQLIETDRAAWEQRRCETRQ